MPTTFGEAASLSRLYADAPPSVMVDRLTVDPGALPSVVSQA